VSAAPDESSPVPPARTPREVRAALLPEEVGEFDTGWRAALARAAETLDLTEVYEVLQHWHRIALMTQADPDAHRRMLQVSQRALAGEAIPTVPLDAVHAVIQERLDH
jgi:hypothetical protein